MQNQNEPALLPHLSVKEHFSACSFLSCGHLSSFLWYRFLFGSSFSLFSPVSLHSVYVVSFLSPLLHVFSVPLLARANEVPL